MNFILELTSLLTLVEKLTHEPGNLITLFCPILSNGCTFSNKVSLILLVLFLLLRFEWLTMFTTDIVVAYNLTLRSQSARRFYSQRIFSVLREPSVQLVSHFSI